PMAPQASSARHSAHHTPLVDPNKSTAQVEYNAGGSSTQQASGQFDQEEVATIAEKLKNNIGGKPAQTVKNTATSGEVSLRGAGAASADDTIIIDKEGNLHYTNEEQSAANQG